MTAADRIYISAEHGTQLVLAGDPPPPWAVEGTPPPSRPSSGAPKADWVAWATSVGIGEADSMTKADIITAAAELAD